MKTVYLKKVLYGWQIFGSKGNEISHVQHGLGSKEKAMDWAVAYMSFMSNVTVEFK